MFQTVGGLTPELQKAMLWHLLQDAFPAAQKNVMPYGDSPTAEGGTSISSKAQAIVPVVVPSTALPTAQLGTLPSRAPETIALPTAPDTYLEDLTIQLQQATADPLPMKAGEWQGSVQMEPQHWGERRSFHNTSSTEVALPGSVLAPARPAAHTALSDIMSNDAAQTGALGPQSDSADVAEPGMVSSSSNIADTLPSDTLQTFDSGVMKSALQTAARVTIATDCIRARAAQTVEDGNLPGITPEMEARGTNTAAATDSGQTLSVHTSVDEHHHETKVSKLCLHPWHVQRQSLAQATLCLSRQVLPDKCCR